MLSPTDVHILTGLILLVLEPAGVEVELGNFVYDAAAKIRRDVDVTVKATAANGNVSVFKGIEVKSHRRKLDSTHVEQLVQKLKDMPPLTHKAIVSATGYTRPAIRKAMAHGVDLYELRSWHNQGETFPWFKSEFVPFSRSNLWWVGNVTARINGDDRVSEEFRSSFSMESPVKIGGKTNSQIETLGDYVRRLQKAATQRWIEITKDRARPSGEFNAYVRVPVVEGVVVAGHDGATLPIREVVFVGKMQWTETTAPSSYKALYRVADGMPLAGCAVGDVGDFGLVGLVVADGHLNVIRIPDEARKTVKIKHQRLRSKETTD